MNPALHIVALVLSLATLMACPAEPSSATDEDVAADSLGNDAHDGVSGDILTDTNGVDEGSDTSPEVTPEVLDAAPDIAPDMAPDMAVDTAPDIATDIAPDIAIDTAPDIAIDTVPDIAPDIAIDTAPDIAIDTVPDIAIDAAPDIVVDTGPDLTVDTSPDLPSDAAPDTAPDTTPDTVADTAPDTVADTAPDAVADTAPDAVADTAPDTATDTANPPQNSVPFTYSSTCAMPDDPQTGGFEEQWVPSPSGTFLDLTHAGDGSNRIFVAERDGRVYGANATNPSWELVLDISALVDAEGEGGLLGLAFDPDFAANGFMYVSYTSSVGGPFRNVWARYTFNDPTQNVADPTSDVVFLENDQPYSNHNGGDIQFGLDGYLYLSIGDGGVGGNLNYNTAQDLTSLLGKILRIDVSTVGPSTSYSIPADNPFVGLGGGVREEVFAYGLRNPWRMTVDRLTGDVWVGDVGEGWIEEVDIITAGSNYGWPWWEGTSCFNASNGCSTVGFTMPVAEYTHDHGASITGGFVYRGSAIPSLYGAYIYSEAWNGNYWTYRHGLEAPSPTPEGVIGGAYSYGEDESGELYMLNWGIRKLVPATGGPTPPPLPATLTETGCFADVASLEPGVGLVPYEPRAPLWSDNVHKKRWVSLPDGGQITYDSSGKWQFPAGTIFIKHFEADVMEAGGPSTKRLETRLVVQDSDGVRGYTYRWNDAQTEAFLLPGAETEVLTVIPDTGPPETVTWNYPSRSQCIGCHTEASGGVLGLETAQLNWATPAVNYPEMGAVNQVAAFGAYGLFDGTLPADLAAEPLLTAVDDTSASAADRARSYLHSNCGNCHLPGGPSGLAYDFRYDTPLADMGACGVVPLRGDLDISGAEILKPGVPAESIIHARMATTGPHRMPPLGTTLVHGEALDAVGAWIGAMESCP